MTNLMDRKWWFFGLSLLIILPGIFSLIFYGLRLGIDFTGGTLFDYRFPKSISTAEIRSVFTSQKIIVSEITPSAVNEEIIKTPPLSDKQVILINQIFQKKYHVTLLSTQSIGPTIGSETTKNAFIAVIVASFAIVFYLAIAFRKVPKPTSAYRFGVTAVVALLHDVLVVLGIFSILGHFFGVEIDILFMTAILTVIGFSVHDTIVVFDRIRENLPKFLSRKFSEVANISIDQTLGRSLNTSLTVIFVLLALLLFGGETIKWFIVALLVGIISGTYSSIFNATALLVLWEEKLGH